MRFLFGSTQQPTQQGLNEEDKRKKEMAKRLMDEGFFEHPVKRILGDCDYDEGCAREKLLDQGYAAADSEAETAIQEYKDRQEQARQLQPSAPPPDEVPRQEQAQPSAPPPDEVEVEEYLSRDDIPVLQGELVTDQDANDDGVVLAQPISGGASGRKKSKKSKKRKQSKKRKNTKKRKQSKKKKQTKKRKKY